MNFRAFIIVAFFFFCFIASNSWSQGWERSYVDSSGMGMGRDVIQIFDGGFYFTSDPCYCGGGQTARLDGNGNVIWSVAIGGNSVVETPDSGCIVVGTQGMVFAVRKLDYSGNMVWSHIFQIYGGQENINDFRKVSSGGYIACGFDNSDGILLRFDENGDTIWTHRTFLPGLDTFIEVSETDDGGFMTTGYADSSGINVLFVLKTDSAGNELWSKTYGTVIFGQIICKTYNDCYAIGGLGTLMKIDNVGNALWIQNLPVDFRIYGIKETPDHGFIAVGYKYSVSTNENIHIIKLDSVANVQWAKTYYSGPDMDFAESVNLVNDGGYIICGSINYAGSVPVLSYIIRTDSLGNTYSNTVSGNVYYDMNSNCVFDSTDMPAPDIMITANGVNGNFVSFTDALGFYSIHTGIGTYTFEQQPPPYRPQICPVTPTFNVSFANANNTSTGHDFYDYIIPNIHDNHITLTADRFRPGLQSSYWLHYKNNGSITESGILWLQMDTSLVFMNSIPPPDSVSNDTLFWSYSNLEMDEAGSINVQVQVPSTIIAGTQLFAKAFIDSIEIDDYPADNIDTIYHTVTASFDPNEKVSYCHNQDSTGSIATTDTLTYTIYFQNTGTDTAFTVKITDVLDTNLDVTTFRMLASSHSYTLQPVTARIFKWVFNNIMLPDSNVNEPASHGFIKYSIRPKPNLQPGTVISNEAKIYFDFNPAVLTNTTTNTIIVPVGIDEVMNDHQENSFIYPNPFSTEALYQFPKVHNGTITIYNAMGEQVSQIKNINGTSAIISRNSFSGGVYFINLSENNHVVAVDKMVIF